MIKTINRNVRKSIYAGCITNLKFILKRSKYGKRKFVASLVISNLVNVSLGYANEKILQQEEMS